MRIVFLNGVYFNPDKIITMKETKDGTILDFGNKQEFVPNVEVKHVIYTIKNNEGV
jgi:hypothetical protein